jgi:cell wall assembly regulator SMI1
MIDAALGQHDAAIREGQRACELLPISKDAWEEPAWATNLAMFYTWLGDNDSALQQLEDLAKHAGLLTYGELKLMPMWDPLRGDPRFEKIVASIAPKDAIQ